MPSMICCYSELLLQVYYLVNRSVFMCRENISQHWLLKLMLMVQIVVV